MKIHFMQKYYRSIRLAYENRKNQFKPQTFKLSAIVVSFIFIFICYSVYLHPAETRFSFHFYLEEGAITILSVTLLTCASLAGYAAFIIAPGKDKRQKVFFLVVAVALTYLALDEILHFHEHVGDSLDDMGFLKVIFRVTNIRRWNDLIIILYGVISLPVFIYFLPTAVQIPYFAECFILAFLSYVGHTAIDSFVEPPTTPTYIIEESFKLYASTFILLGLITTLLYLINSKEIQA